MTPTLSWVQSLHQTRGGSEDLLAVVQGAGLQQPVLVSWEPNGVARRAVSTRPDLFGSMVLLNPSPSTHALVNLLGEEAAGPIPGRTIEERSFPSRIRDADFDAWLARAGRSGASPSSAARLWGHLLAYEPTLTPPGITTPTLLIHNRDCMQPETEVLTVAEAIPDATSVQVAGVDVYPVAGDVDLLITEITGFVTGGPSSLTPLRQLAAVLFTDLVDSTRRAVDEGDAHWRDLLDVHDRTVRQCVRHHGGRVVKYTGDGVLALMPSAVGALETVASIREQLVPQGLRIRAGIHVGDVDLRGDDVSGLAVNVAARIMHAADPDETLVSESARQATLGTPHRFDAARTTLLKGLPEQWTLHRHVPDGRIARRGP